MTDPRIAAAQHLARELLAPTAAEVERTAVPRSHLDALGQAGLLRLLNAPRSVTRAVTEILAGACPTTWFVQAQHHNPVAMLAASDAPVRDRLLPRLLTGELVAGFAFAYLRSFPERPMRAERAEDGWRVTGTAPWYTGWGLNDVALVGALDDADCTVWGFVEAVPGRGLRPSEPMETLAVAGARTVRLEFKDVTIPDVDVVARIPLDEWLTGDAARTSDAVPAVFGVTAAAVRLLADAGERHEEAAALARQLAARLEAIRARCYELADAGAPLELRREARAESYALLTTVTTAAVAASGGRAIAPGAEAGRLARTGLFLLVQAQTGAIRTATLRRWRRFGAGG